ncbi:MAG: magnesium transporter CorA family protein [Anaerolineales bacterium]|nr:magnesium transporter CorA family protein [Anaerolineales bacterium]
MVTHHDAPIEAVDQIWKTCQRDERIMKGGPDHLLYRILDEIASRYMPVVEKLDLAIDELEDDIFIGKNTATLEKLFTLKRAVLYLQRILARQREVLNQLARDPYDQIDAKDRVYFRDVYDHLVRLYDIIESVRDLISGTMDTYLSVINNRMNEIMKTLTVITTLFMPLSFVTGFFGMNFLQPSAPLNIWTGLPAFLVTLAIILFTPLVMFGWMRHRKWM